MTDKQSTLQSWRQAFRSWDARPFDDVATTRERLVSVGICLPLCLLSVWAILSVAGLWPFLHDQLVTHHWIPDNG